MLALFLSTTQEAKAIFSVSSTNPADGSTSIGRDPSFTITFPINACPYSVQAYIKLASDDSVIDTITFMDYSGGGTQNLTFTSHVTLDPNTAYYVDVSSSAFYDCVPGFTNLSDVYRIDFNTGTCTGAGPCPTCYPINAMVCCATPEEATIKHLSPPDNAHFMQSYEGLSITFNGTLAVATGDILIREYIGDAIVETIDITSDQVTGWGTPTITLNPSINLAHNTHYYVNFPIDAYRDTPDKDSWDFWTKATPNTMSGTGL